MQYTFSTPIEYIPHVGPAFGKRLKTLKIKTLGDLVFYFPKYYQDYSNIKRIDSIKINESACIKGSVLEIQEEKSLRKRMAITKAVIQDETASIEVVWFNQPYIFKNIKKGDTLILAGKIAINNNHIYLSSPTFEKVSDKENMHLGKIAGVYSETKGITSRWIRFVLKPILDEIKNKIPETLPEEVIKKHDLISLREALYQIHFPTNMELAQKAQERFSFENIFMITLFAAKKKIENEKETSIPVPINKNVIDRFLDDLPFELTQEQKKSGWQIIKDMTRSYPMNRLLQGDVGSGKTVVSIMATINTVKNKSQVVVMAPTEILAKQHFKTFFNILKGYNINIGLLTGKEDKYYSKKLKSDTIEISRERLLKKTADGEIDVLIGTHALIASNPKKKTAKRETKVLFNNLGLVVVDEQHRFGVKQRAALCGKMKDKIPHLLSMTATPIPRSLALTIWGDLDLSTITEMPKGRKVIKTNIITETNRQKAYNFIEEQIKDGRQAFVICPRIDANDEKKEIMLEMKNVKEEYDKLSKKIFPHRKIEILHGKMTPKEKEKIMRDFRLKKFDILVSTSVVEVGIDIPNATVMMIEGADRFGLAQLHQFRGRVGRGEYQSYCFLLTDSSSTKTNQRLQAMIKYDSGFKLSEMDLKIRGPGDFFGVRQWGIPDFAMNALKDSRIIEKIKETAEEIIGYDIQLKKYPTLKVRLESFSEKIHLE
ncbi:MAG: ATP-dependent DNA helicase RecG [Candidatus Paceibacterota bacterium]|jgi:ATP-dependent DNA helicase RecG|nr:ATP-dependent DNA helicase RecG [bacterium]